MQAIAPLILIGPPMLSLTVNLPGVSSIGTRSVFNGDVDLSLCRKLTIGDGHVEEQVLASLERRSKKRCSIPDHQPYAVHVTFLIALKETAIIRALCPNVTLPLELCV